MNNWTYTSVRVTRRTGSQLLLNCCLNHYKYARTSKLEHKVQKRIQFCSRETLHFHFHSCWARPRKSQRHSLANCRHCWPKLQLTVRKSTGHVQKGQRDFPIFPCSLLLNLSPLLTPLPLSFSGYLTPAHRLSISPFPFPNLRILSSILPLLGSLSIAPFFLIKWQVQTLPWLNRNLFDEKSICLASKHSSLSANMALIRWQVIWLTPEGETCDLGSADFSFSPFCPPQKTLPSGTAVLSHCRGSTRRHGVRIWIWRKKGLIDSIKNDWVNNI